MRRLLFALLLLAGVQISAPAQAQVIPGCATPGSTQPASCVQPGLGNAGYPIGSTPQAQSATGTTGAVSATLPAIQGQYEYFCLLKISTIGGTATISPITLSGLQGGNFIIQGVNSSVAGNTYEPVPLVQCLRAATPNTAITATTTADGTATSVNVYISGYSQ